MMKLVIAFIAGFLLGYFADDIFPDDLPDNWT